MSEEELNKVIEDTTLDDNAKIIYSYFFVYEDTDMPSWRIENLACLALDITTQKFQEYVRLLESRGYKVEGA